MNWHVLGLNGFQQMFKESGMSNALIKVRIVSNAIPMMFSTFYVLYVYLLLFSGVPIQAFHISNKVVQMLVLFIYTVIMIFLLRDTITPPISLYGGYIEYRLLHFPWKRVRWDEVQKVESDRKM
jgi:hypothetical protein